MVSRSCPDETKQIYSLRWSVSGVVVDMKGVIREVFLHLFWNKMVFWIVKDSFATLANCLFTQKSPPVYILSV